MKRFYKITAGLFLAGLVLMGAGGAIMLLEMSQFTYKPVIDPNDIEMVTEEKNIVLPDNLAKIYRGYNGAYFDLEIDEGLKGNNAVLETKHIANEEVEAELRFYEDYRLHNNYTDNFSKYCVNVVEMGYYRNFTDEKDDFELFKEMIGYFKEGIIYYNNHYEFQPDFKLKVSPEAYERFEERHDGYSLYSYVEYMDYLNEKAVEEYAEYDDNVVEEIDDEICEGTTVVFYEG